MNPSRKGSLTHFLFLLITKKRGQKDAEESRKISESKIYHVMIKGNEKKQNQNEMN